MKTQLPLLLASGLLAGCGTNRNTVDPRVVMFNDFETLNGWAPAEQTTTLTEEQAHSGRYCLKAGAGQEFSLSYSRPLSQTFLTRPTKVRVSAWVLAPSLQTQAVLVTSIATPGAPADAKPLLWAGLRLDGAVKEANQWVNVSQVVALPATILPEHLLTIYLWNTGAEPAYVDDIVVRQE